MPYVDPWGGTVQGLKTLGDTFDTLESSRIKRIEMDRQARRDALQESLTKVQIEGAASDLEEKRRKTGMLRAYDEAQRGLEAGFDTTTAPTTELNPDYQPSSTVTPISSIKARNIESNNDPSMASLSDLPTAQTPAIGDMTRPGVRPLTEAEKTQQRIALALKHGQEGDITKIAAVYDISEKLATENGTRMTLWAKALDELRKARVGPDALRKLAPMLASKFGMNPAIAEGIDFAADGGIIRLGPNGNYYRLSPDGTSLHEFKPSTEGATSHITRDVPDPKGRSYAGGTMWGYDAAAPGKDKYTTYLGPGKQPTFMAQMPGIDSIKADAVDLARGALNREAWTRYNRTPAHMAQLRQAVREIHPNFDFLKASINMQNMADKSFIRGKENVQSVLDSAELGREYIKALNNNNIEYANRVANRWAEITGRPAPTNWKVFAVAMAQEFNRAYSDSVVNPEGRFNKEISNLDLVRSPEQLMGSLDTNIALTKIRGEAINRMLQPYSWEEVQTGKKSAPVRPGAGAVTGKKFSVDAAGNVTETK